MRIKSILCCVILGIYTGNAGCCLQSCQGVGDAVRINRNVVKSLLLIFRCFLFVCFTQLKHSPDCCKLVSGVFIKLFLRFLPVYSLCLWRGGLLSSLWHHFCWLNIFNLNYLFQSLSWASMPWVPREQNLYLGHFCLSRY